MAELPVANTWLGTASPALFVHHKACPAGGEPLQDVALRLVGRHQCANAGLAASAARFLAQQGMSRITQDHIVQGLGSATLLARFQARPACRRAVRLQAAADRAAAWGAAELLGCASRLPSSHA